MDEVVAAMASNERKRQALAALEDAEIKRAGQMLGGGFSGRMHIKGVFGTKTTLGTIMDKELVHLTK